MFEGSNDTLGVYVTLLPTSMIKVGKGGFNRAYVAQTYFTSPIIVLLHWASDTSGADERRAHAALKAYSTATHGNRGARELYQIEPLKCAEILIGVLGWPRHVAPELPISRHATGKS